MQFINKPKRRVIINITSLIDVLFLLLIFFLVSSTFLEQPGMKLDLPETSGKEVTRVEGHTIFITKEESLYLNDKAIPIETLLVRLKEMIQKPEESEITLKADEKVRYGFVVEIMDIIKKSGIQKLILATRLKEETDESY